MLRQYTRVLQMEPEEDENTHTSRPRLLGDRRLWQLKRNLTNLQVDRLAQTTLADQDSSMPWYTRAPIPEKRYSLRSPPTAPIPRIHSEVFQSLVEDGDLWSLHCLLWTPCISSLLVSSLFQQEYASISLTMLMRSLLATSISKA